MTALPTWQEIEKKSTFLFSQFLEIELTPELKLTFDFCASRISVYAWDSYNRTFKLIEEHNELFGFHQFPSMKETYLNLINQ